MAPLSTVGKAGTTKDSYGAYFPDLAANMLGSYVMGFLAAASALGVKSKKPVGFLPPGHPFQAVTFIADINSTQSAMLNS